MTGQRALTAAEVEAFRVRLQTAGLADEQRPLVQLLSALESLKATAAGVQAAAAVSLEATVVRNEEAVGVAADARGKGVNRQVALATRQSPARTQTLLRAARVWSSQMPHTFQALRSGRLSEFRALIVVAETAQLTPAQRAEVDRRLFADPAVTRGLGTKRLADLVRGLADELDPLPAHERHERARKESAQVVLEPVANGMAWLHACVPTPMGVAMKSSLDAAVAQVPYGQRGQALVGELYARVTGNPSDVMPVTVNLVVSDATLLGAGHESATLLDSQGTGYGKVPAQVARTLVAGALDAGSAWLRRIYASEPGDLVAASSRQRFFPDGLAAMLTVRDQGICRTPYCDAPVRHLDHITPARAGGATDLANGAGLCVRCNQAKESPGWVAVPGVDPDTGRHVIRIVDPTGGEYESLAPALPVPAVSAPAPRPDTVPDTVPESWVEDALARRLAPVTFEWWGG